MQPASKVKPRWKHESGEARRNDSGAAVSEADVKRTCPSPTSGKSTAKAQTSPGRGTEEGKQIRSQASLSETSLTISQAASELIRSESGASKGEAEMEAQERRSYEERQWSGSKRSQCEAELPRPDQWQVRSESTNEPWSWLGGGEAEQKPSELKRSDSDRQPSSIVAQSKRSRSKLVNPFIISQRIRSHS